MRSLLILCSTVALLMSPCLLMSFVHWCEQAVLKNLDITGKQTYVLADGSKLQSSTFTIRSLKVGDKVVENVRGSVAATEGNLLLGQSFLERFKFVVYR